RLDLFRGRRQAKAARGAIVSRAAAGWIDFGGGIGGVWWRHADVRSGTKRSAQGADCVGGWDRADQRAGELAVIARARAGGAGPLLRRDAVADADGFDGGRAANPVWQSDFRAGDRGAFLFADGL